MRSVFSRAPHRRRFYEESTGTDPESGSDGGQDRDRDRHRQQHTEFWAREELIALLSVAGTLAGLSVTVVAFMDKPRGRAAESISPATTVVDDLFSLCALLFLVCVYLIFIALRTRNPKGFSWLVRMVDVAFAAGLTMMTAAGFVLVYTVW